MTQFENDLLKKYTQFTIDDLHGFGKDAVKKVRDMGLPKDDCVISTMFVDANETNYHRCEYCLLNCGFRCEEGKNYKKVLDFCG